MHDIHPFGAERRAFYKAVPSAILCDLALLKVGQPDTLHDTLTFDYLRAVAESMSLTVTVEFNIPVPKKLMSHRGSADTIITQQVCVTLRTPQHTEIAVTCPLPCYALMGALGAYWAQQRLAKAS